MEKTHFKKRSPNHYPAAKCAGCMVATDCEVDGVREREESPPPPPLALLSLAARPLTHFMWQSQWIYEYFTRDQRQVAPVQGDYTVKAILPNYLDTHVSRSPAKTEPKLHIGCALHSDGKHHPAPVNQGCVG